MSNLVNPQYPPDFRDITPSDRRNIVDHYKFVEDQLIRGDLDTKRTELILIAENWGYDFNLGTLIRNSNAFLAKGVKIVGRKQYDKRGAVGTYKYEHIEYVPTLAPLVSKLKDQGYRIVVMDNIDGAADIQTHVWQPKSAIIFGQEGIGVTPESLSLADDVVYIPQLGSVRSLNVGTSSGIAIYDYMSKVGGFNA